MKRKPKKTARAASKTKTRRSGRRATTRRRSRGRRRAYVLLFVHWSARGPFTREMRKAIRGLRRTGGGSDGRSSDASFSVSEKRAESVAKKVARVRGVSFVTVVRYDSESEIVGGAEFKKHGRKVRRSELRRYGQRRRRK